MSDQSVLCPKCGHAIPLTEALSRQIREQLRRELEAPLVEKERSIANRSRELDDKEKSLDRIVAERVQQERPILETQLKQEAKREVASEVEFLKSQNAEKDRRLREAERTELELRRERVALQEAHQRLKLEVARQVDAEREQIRRETAKRVTEEYRLKDLEKDKKLTEMKAQIEELKRKAEQGSQQTQGEVLELDLEQMLRSRFPTDQIEPVPKGMAGADVLQIVKSPSGQFAGTIIWETKRTRGWNEGWVQKLKENQRNTNAEISVLVTQVLPKDIDHFEWKDGVWITTSAYAFGLATALRQHLIQVALTKLSTIGKNEKMEVLYTYLTSTEFRHRVEAIVETFVTMQGELGREKRAITRMWEERDKQIQQVVNNIAGMYGDMQGIIGSSLPSIKSLSLPGNLEPRDGDAPPF